MAPDMLVLAFSGLHPAVSYTLGCALVFPAHGTRRLHIAG